MKSEIHTHNTELQPYFSVTEYFWMIIICGFVPAGCSAEACVGVGKRSSPPQADGAAGSQQLQAACVRHDQNDGFNSSAAPPNTRLRI